MSRRRGLPELGERVRSHVRALTGRVVDICRWFALASDAYRVTVERDDTSRFILFVFESRIRGQKGELYATYGDGAPIGSRKAA
jgi:hypothetical protein